MNISLITPSRGRPEKMQRMWQSARQTAHNPDNLHLCLGVDQDEMTLYGKYAGGDNVSIYELRDWGVVFSVNTIVSNNLRQMNPKLFMMAADDTVFSTPEWDKALLEHYDALENKIHVYSFLDSRSEEGTPHPIGTREYVSAMGYFSTPIFMHWFSDTWMVEIAKANGCFTHLKDYLLVHDKSSDRGKPDNTHTRIRERGWLDRDTNVDNMCKHFLQIEKRRLADILRYRNGRSEHLD